MYYYYLNSYSHRELVVIYVAAIDSHILCLALICTQHLTDCEETNLASLQTHPSFTRRPDHVRVAELRATFDACTAAAQHHTDKPLTIAGTTTISYAHLMSKKFVQAVSPAYAMPVPSCPSWTSSASKAGSKYVCALIIRASWSPYVRWWRPGSGSQIRWRSSLRLACCARATLSVRMPCLDQHSNSTQALYAAVSGFPGKTQAGELSVFANEVELRHCQLKHRLYALEYRFSCSRPARTTYPSRSRIQRSVCGSDTWT